MNKEEFIKEIKELKLEINDEHLKKLEQYYKLLVEWNNKFNLTRITEENEVYLKHFYDSICLIKAVNLNNYETLADIGTGAGFPGIVLAIFYKNLNITLIESNGKRCSFLEEVKNKLNLKNVSIINSRAETFSKKNREIFDIITCRAVSHLNTLIEICVPALKVNGYFVPLKGEIAEEIEESKDKIVKLKLNPENIISYNLPIENSIRNIPVLKKLYPSDKMYPREYNKIIKDLKKDKK